MKITSPMLLTVCILSRAHSKCKICDPECIPSADSYFQHTTGDSWHHWDSWLFNYVIFCHWELMILLAYTSFILVDKFVLQCVT